MVSAPAAEDDVVVGKNSSGFGPIQVADEMLDAIGIDPVEVRLEPEIGHFRREAVVGRGPLQHDQTRRRGRTAIDHMNMFRRIKAPAKKDDVHG